MTKEDNKVISMELRRKAQMGDDNDPVILQAREITDLLGRQQMLEATQSAPLSRLVFAVNQLLSLELAANALSAVFRHAFTPEEYNELMVELAHRKRGVTYTIEWPKHDTTDTYLQLLPPTITAGVTSLHGSDDEDA